MKFATLAALAATVVADDSNPDWYSFLCTSNDDCGGDICAGHKDYADKDAFDMDTPMNVPYEGRNPIFGKGCLSADLCDNSGENSDGTWFKYDCNPPQEGGGGGYYPAGASKLAAAASAAVVALYAL